jgi:Domain of unknown function (DUF6456)
MAKRKHRATSVKRATPVERARAEPTGERLRHARGDVERGATGQLTMRDSPLERALRRGVLTRAQYDAGVKYRHHWYHAGLADGLRSPDLDRVFAVDVSGFSGMAKTEAQVFHRQRWREAGEAVGLVGLQVLDAAVCREVPLEEVGYMLGWSARAAAIVAATERLKAALDGLAALWGIGRDNPPAAAVRARRSTADST